MTEQTAIEFIKQYMRANGKSRNQYHIEPVNLSYDMFFPFGKSMFLEINANNQLYVLTNIENYYGFQVLAENNYFNADFNRKSTGEFFTGSIRIESISNNWTLLPQTIANNGNNNGVIGQTNNVPAKNNYITFIKAVMY